MKHPSESQDQAPNRPVVDAADRRPRASTLEPGPQALQRLLAGGETLKERSRDVTLAAGKIPGYPFENALQIREFHGYLQLAADTGAIKLEWQAYYENQQLARIRLLDARALAHFLDRDFLPDRIDAVFTALDRDHLAPWLQEALDLMRNKWQQGQMAFGLGIEDADRLHDVLRAASQLSTGLAAGDTLDYRQFGARYLGNSKRTKELVNNLAALLRWHTGLKDLKPQDLLRQFNLVPLQQPVLLTGPVQLSDGKQTLNIDVYPYIGVPESFLGSIEPAAAATYILTIENQSSFNEYTASISDGGIVIYTGGFPTSRLQRFYRHLTDAIAAPCYHWGDTDAYGFEILKTLQQIAPERIVTPHLMNPGSGTGARYSREQLAHLQRLLPVNAVTDGVISKLLAQGVGLQEQESQVARSPLDTGASAALSPGSD